MVLLALKTALAAGICYWLATLFGLQDGYWGSISAIIVLQSNVGSTVSASRDRLIGTLIGAAVGAAFSLLGSGIWPYLLAVVTAMVTCSLLSLKNSARLAGVTVTILMLVHRNGSNWKMPLHRVLEVLLGIVVALTISTLVLPSRARERLQDGLAQEFLLLGALFEALLLGFRGGQETPIQLRTEASKAIEANSLLREAARHEPSSGQPSYEGLLVLEQYGRQCWDLLQALELAFTSSKDSGYAAQLEPELGLLVTNIHRGFENIARCIYRWRFDPSSVSLRLDDDVAALEKKMTAIRPIGLSYAQEEILRAYAMQLHLKQLARLMRTARIECAQASSA